MNDFWDQRFSGDGYRFGTEPAAFLTRQADRLVAGARALAICDGEGRNGVWLAGQGLRVTSFDAAPVGVDKARALATARGVPLEAHVSGVEDWTWAPDAFDLVAGVFFQFAAPELRARIFDGIARTLKPGGLLLLHGYAPRQVAYGTGGPGKAENLYTLDLLEQAFAGWQVLEGVDYDAEIAEGDGHVGRSALIDFVAVKPG
mgnify:CR=1 FL=1